jgi:Concanavalin A-like lectin/glucanases superfamily
MSLIYGNSFQTNGTTQSARSANGVASAVTNNFSMVCWLNLIATPAGDDYFFDNGANDARGMGLYIHSDGVLHCDYSFVADVNSAFTINTATWYHVGIIRDTGTSQLYVNGVAKGSTIANAPNSGNDYVSIGAGVNSAGTLNGFLNCKVDDARFYERAITGAEILQLYNNGNVWPYTDISSVSLKYWYKFDESSGNPQDSSGNGIHLTNNGTSPYVTGIVATGSTSSTVGSLLMMTR